MVAHNISPDTLNLVECEDRFELEEFEYDFCQDEQGFFPELVENLVEDRYRLKERMQEIDNKADKYQQFNNRQQAEKILANSVGPDTYLVLKDPEDKICIRSIEEFYEVIETDERHFNGSSYKEVKGWKTLSVEGDEAVFKPVYATTRHDPEDAYKIKTKMGNVTVTGDHSLISMKGEPSNRIRDSEFEGLKELKGSDITSEDVVAQVNDLDLVSTSHEVIVPEVLKDCPENFHLYIPKSENLEKREWYKRRVGVIDAVKDGLNSEQINSNPQFGDKTLRNAIEEGLVQKKKVIGSQGNTYECEVTEKGKEYRKFYSTFKEREKNSRHYLISLDDLDVIPPRDLLENSFVANKSGRARNKVPAVLELTEDFGSLLGWFVAEGHVGKSSTEELSYMDLGIASDNADQREEIQRLFKQVFDYDASINGGQVTCCTSTIARIFSELCGSKAEEKKVPEHIFNCPEEVRKSFLHSYSLGDGDEDGRRLSTISKKLQSGLSTLLKEDDCIVHNGYDTGTFRISRRTKTQGQKIVSGDLYGQKPVKVEKIEEPEKVYDISVQDTEKFVTAEGLVLHNSFYGYLGYSGARWYSKESAEATTYLGREYIKDAIDIAQDRGLEMIYGDTDSVMLSADNIKEKMDDFLEEVNSELPEFMELEFEGFFRRGLFTSKESGEGAKKKYALIDGEGNLKITGFEQVRRDWSPIAKRTQKNVLRKVLEDDVDGAVEEVKETIQRLKSGEVDVEDLKIYTTLTKEPEEYDSTSPHVEAAKKAIERGKKIEPETTIDYVITRKGDSISDKAEITEHAESYDADYYIENQVLPVTHRVLKVFGYTEDQLKGKGKQSGLGRF
jgi:DNA polymerase I